MNKESFLSFRLLSQAAFWILFGSFVLTVSGWSLPWPIALYRALLITGCHLFNFYFFYSFVIPRFYEKRKYLATALGLLLLLAGITPLRIFAETVFGIPLPIDIPYAARVALVLISEITIVAFATLLRIAAVNEENRKHFEILKRERLEAELKFLKGQISPHFLFNSINNIYGLVLTNSGNGADALLKLSALLRYTLYDSNGKVSVGTEIEAIKTYAVLFSLRSEDKMDVQWTIVVSKYERLIEAMVLMPLIENVFKHSGLGILRNASARIDIGTDDNWITIRTWNTIGNMTTSEERGGIGMDNIRRRLTQLYPGNHEFSVRSTPNAFEVNLRMPLS